MEISYLMTRCPVILSETATALEATQKMKEMKCGVLPIGNENSVKGVVTDRDIMMRASLKGKDLSKVPVKDVMTRETIFCHQRDILQRAIYMMNKYNVKRMLVEDDEHKLVGIISMSDILRRLPDPLALATLLHDVEYAMLYSEEMV